MEGSQEAWGTETYYRYGKKGFSHFATTSAFLWRERLGITADTALQTIYSCIKANEVEGSQGPNEARGPPGPIGENTAIQNYLFMHPS